MFSKLIVELKTTFA